MTASPEPLAPSPGTTLALLAAATAIGSLGLAAGGTAGALLATEMTGSAATAGLPLGALVAGSAAGALAIARRTSRTGRAGGLILGYALGTVGAAVVIAATIARDFALVLAGSAVLGAANAAVFLTRYAAADIGGPAARGRALGTVFVATAVGAVASPNLLGTGGELAGALGLLRLAGLYLIAAPAFVIAGLILAALARPGVPSPGRGAASLGAKPAKPVLRRDVVAGLRAVPVRIALLVLAAVNLVMVAIMAIAPVHLTAHGHGLEFVGLVVSIHVLGMFAPAPLSGWLADRAGSAVVAAIGAALLIAAGLAGALVDPASGPAFTLVLALLGLGWNAGVVGGSTLLAASVPAALRPHAEGVGEVAMGLAAAVGAPVAGLIAALGGFAALAAFGAGASALALAAARWGGREAATTGEGSEAAA